MALSAVSSRRPPMTVRLRAGPASAAGVTSTAAAPALAAEPPANTSGSSRQASCQAGMALSEVRTAVYVATAGPRGAAPVSHTLPNPGKRPVTSEAAAAPHSGPKTVISHVPTLIGDVGLATRSML